jgi:glycosyltransferase involved in cell wall biosynthesis
MLTNIPYIIGQTGISIERKVKNNKALSFFVKILIKYSFKVNCPGSRSVLFWSSQYPKLRDRFNILHSTIDTDLFLPQINNGKEYDFIYLGMLNPEKNIDIIIKGLALLNYDYSQKRTLQIVGKGPEYPLLKNLTETLQVEEFVHFKGFSNSPISNLNNSKFLIMASSSEGLPTSMMQGMACKIVPITNLVGNIADIVKDEVTGFVVYQLDEINMAKALFKAISCETTMFDNMKSNCREIIVNNHSHNASIKKWSEILR